MANQFRFVPDVAKGAVDDLVVAYHYSHRPAAAVQFAAGLECDGKLVAGCSWSLPTARWHEPVLELTRLVRRDDVPAPLTMLIGAACRELRGRGFDLLVSYADVTQDHHGGVYQAASWQYHGQRHSRVDGFLVNGRFVPRRSLNNTIGTSSYAGVVDAYGGSATVERHWDLGKHLYWRALTKGGKAKAGRLGLRSGPYPKPDGRADEDASRAMRSRIAASVEAAKELVRPEHQLRFDFGGAHD